MNKILCWICGKQIISHREHEKHELMPGVEIEEICKECAGELRELITQMTEAKTIGSHN